MPQLRVLDVAASSVAPTLRVLDITGTVAAQTRVRLYDISGTLTRRVTALVADQTVEPGSTVTLHATLDDGTDADSYTWRVISGSVSLSTSGGTCTFTAPSPGPSATYPPATSTVTIGVTGTVGAVTGAEDTSTVTVNPPLSFVWNGTAFVQRPVTYN